jgi:hypothetical protein
MSKQPIPFRLDPGATRETAVASLVRSALAIARGVREAHSPADIAQRTWGREASRDVALVMRSASTPATTTGVGWADTIAHITMQFIATLVPQSAAAGLIDRGLQLAFDGSRTINLPVMSLTPSAGFIGETKAIPIVQYTTAAGTSLSPHKFAVMTSLTSEMAAASNAEAILRTQLANAAALGLDSAMFSTAAGTADQPAGLLNGVSATTASSASVLTDAMLSDLSTLGGAVARVAGGNVCYIAAPEQSIAIGINIPDFGYPVLPTSALPKGTVIAIAPAAFASAFDPMPSVDASIEAEAHMETVPGEIVTAAGTIAAPIASVFQTDRILLRMRMPVAWTMRATGAIAWAQNVVW